MFLIEYEQIGLESNMNTRKMSNIILVINQISLKFVTERFVMGIFKLRYFSEVQLFIKYHRVSQGFIICISLL